MSAQWRQASALFGLAAIPLLVLGVFFLVPVLGMISRGFVVNDQFTWALVLEALARPRTRQVLWFTAWSSTVATVASLALGIPAAHVLYRLRFRGARWLRSWVLVPFVLPTVVVGVAFRELFRAGGLLGWLDWDGSAWAVLCGLVFFNVSVVIRIVGTAWAGLSSRPEAAAAALGAAPWRVFWSITWPRLRQPIANSAIVVFLFCATAFGVVLTLGGVRYATVETEIYLLTTNLLDLPAASALALLQLALVVVLLAASGRTQRGGARAEPGGRVAPRSVRRADGLALGVTGLLGLGLALPIVALAWRTVHTENGWTLAAFAGLNSVGQDTLQVTAVEALQQSLRTAIDATWIALLLGLPIAVVVTRPVRTRWLGLARRFLAGVFVLPLGVSAVTLGFGLLLTLGQRPAFPTQLLVPLAQALVALPLVVRSLTGVLAAIDDRQRQVAATLGASPMRVWASVDWARVRRPLAAAAGFAFAVSLGEFGATSFLAREDQLTLPTLIYRLLSTPGVEHYPTALAAALTLAAVSAGVMLLVEWWSDLELRGW